MPIIAVAAAAISVAGVGAAGFGAILAGTASIGTMMAGVAAVGATLGAIGAVAGIDELKTAGMVLGGIGGVGAIANAVGAFGANATMASVFGGAEAVAGASAGQTAASLINGPAGLGTGTSDLMTGFVEGGSKGIVDAANNIGGFDVLSTTVQVPGAASKAMDIASAASDVLKPVTENIMEGPTNADNASAAGGEGDMATNGAKMGPLDPLKVTGKVGVPGAAEGGGLFGKDGFFSTAGGGMLGMGVVQAAGSFLSGAFDPLKPAQADAYKAQAAANNAAAALQNKQNSNMNEPIPVARRVPVTGKIGGMINSAPVVAGAGA